jgi:signal peptidase I
LNGLGEIANVRKEAGREKGLQEAGLPVREGLRDHGFGLRKIECHASTVQNQQEEFVSLPVPTCDSSGSLELFEEVLRRFGSARLRTQGTSMMPAICPGDEVLIQSCDSNECGVDDVVAFRREGRIFVHRIIKSEEGRMVTQGDAVAIPDAPVTADEFLGKVTAVVRDGANVNTAPSLVQRAAAAIFRRSRTCASVFQKLATL